MGGTERWFTKTIAVTGLIILLFAFGTGSAMVQAATTDTSAYNMDGLPFILDGSALDGGVSEDSGTDMDYAAQELGIQDEMEGLQQFLNKVIGQQGGIQGNFSFWELMKELVKENLKGILGQAGAGIQNTLFSKVRRSGHILFRVAVIGIMGAVLSSVSSMFKGGQISNTGFLVIYVLLSTCLAASFTANLQVVAQVLDQIPEFIKLVMPIYFMSMAFSGGSMSALALYEGMLGTAILIQWVCSTVPFSMVKTYVLMVLGSHVVKGALLTKLTELLEQVMGWNLKTLTGPVVGSRLIRSMILPYVGMTSRTGTGRLLGIVPGLGQGVRVIAQMVLGSGVLIKDTTEAAAVVVLAVVTATPAIELMMLIVLYQCVAVVMQPIRGKRVVSYVSGVSRGHKPLIQTVLHSMFLFMISIVTTCASTNASYFASQSLSEQSTR